MNVRGGALACATLALSGAAAAHGFGTRYDLPIPLSLYVTGAGLVVLLSFVALSCGVRSSTQSSVHAMVHGSRWRGVLPLTRSIGLLIYLLVIVAGLLGVQAPFKNIVPVLVWAIWWVGLTYVSAFLGDVWVLMNPLDTLFRWGARIARRSRARTETGLVPYPEGLGVWPGVLLFLGFTWMEIVWDESDRPAYIAGALLAYSALTWIGMILFGRRTWLHHGEVFTLVFGLLARFAPVDVRVHDLPNGRDTLALALRPYATGLLRDAPLDRSQVALVMVLLSAVSFDGFVETPVWAAIAGWASNPVLLKTASLITAPCLFLGIFILVCRLTLETAGAIAIGGQACASAWRVAGLFASTLVPIAIAYHLAHYLSFLEMAGQYLVPLVSDPLGRGWDLFGTVNYFVRPGWIDARVVWNVSVAAIVTGHVAAVYLAHRQALQEFTERRAAVRSQYPMLALMVGYTMLSLWIIAQPIVTSR